MTEIQHAKHLFRVLDGIRGIGAILVAMRHTSLFFEPYKFQESYLAVDIFFLLSGLVITYAYENRLKAGLSIFNFTLMRLIRIYPLYILGCAISFMAVIMGIAAEANPNHIGLYALLALFLIPNFTLGERILYPLNGPSWTLLSEIIANVVYAAFFKFMKKRNIIIIMAISAFGMASGIALGREHTLDIGWTPKGYFFVFFRVGYSYFAGVLLYQIYKGAHFRVSLNNKQTFYGTWIILLLSAFLLMISPSEDIHPYYDFIVVTIIFPAIVYAAVWCHPLGLTSRICKFLGAISYPIYALHDPLGKYIRNYLNYSYHIEIQYYAPYVGLMFFSLLLPLCLILEKYYDIPVRQFLLSYLIKPRRINKY